LRIKSLFIKNFRSLSLVDVSNLPSFIIIVGENGIGKSSVFDAIRVARAAIIAQQYASNETIYWQDQQRTDNLIQVGQDEMVIKIGFEPNTEREVQEIGSNEASVQVTYRRGE
jgi:AAA15 family ATPase/GTPase